MADQTKIQWADATWNPMTGCAPVSEGCAHCYAERMARRFVCVTCSHCGGVGSDWSIPFHCRECGGTGETHFEPTFHPDRLDIPLHWRKPRRVFVCSMGDLFHEAITDEQIDEVFAVMSLAWRHTFILLTKRPGRMHRYLLDGRDRITEQAHATGRYIEATWSAPRLMTAYARTGAEWEAAENVWPLPNLWLGVTVENQARADERIPILLDTPAAVRFVSVEPMLGPVDLWKVRHWCEHCQTTHSSLSCFQQAPARSKPWLDWLILGGETGPGARPMQPQWALDVWRQCKAAGVPFFWKQGSNGIEYDPEMVTTREYPEEVWTYRKNC